MSLQCIARALTQQGRGCSCGVIRQIKFVNRITNTIKPAESTSLVSRVQHFKTSPARFAPHGHDHSKLWTIERALSASLIVVLPSALLVPSQGLDVLLAISLVLHGHWGIEATVVDYVSPRVFGPAIPKVALGLVYALSILTLAGLLQITFNDKGLAKTIRHLWSVTA